jgi:mRNA interferase MazF
MVIRRGEVWWADLGSPVGSEPEFRRPVVVVQSDAFNRSKIQTVVAVTLTTNLRLGDAPGNVLIPKAQSGLPRDSVANVSNVVTVDQAQLAKRERNLPPLLTRAIDRGLRLVLDL